MSLASQIESTFKQHARELFDTLQGEQLVQAERAAWQWAYFNELALLDPEQAAQYRRDAAHAQGVLVNLAAQVRLDAERRMRETLAEVVGKALGFGIQVLANV